MKKLTVLVLAVALTAVFLSIAFVGGKTEAAAAEYKISWFAPIPHPYFDSVKKGIEAWNESMVQFYDAPTIIVIVIDKMLQSKWPIVDVGLVAGYITLAAQEHDLGTCVMRAIVDYPEQVRKLVGIPDSKFIIIGIAIGYPDWDHPINKLRTNREEIENIVTFVE